MEKRTINNESDGLLQDVEQKKLKYYEIIKTLFEKEFPVFFSESTINSLIENAMVFNERSITLKVPLIYSLPRSLSLAKIIRKNASLWTAFSFGWSFYLTCRELNDLCIGWLKEHNDVLTYVIEDSPAVEKLCQLYENKGYNVNTTIYTNYLNLYESFEINISWEHLKLKPKPSLTDKKEEENEEIEKKFRIKYIPKDLDVKEELLLSQNYFAVTDNAEWRIRKKTNSKGETVYKETHKEGKGEVRKEKEWKLDKDIGEITFNNQEKVYKPINKKRFLIPYKGKTVEMDIFSDEDVCDFVGGKGVAEIEFESVEEMNSFEFPKWFGEEVNFSNSDIWKHINKIDYF